ncbi:uncharacterized protein L969DRAFT_18383 [Mixia osmundae IAM 14324]|nr:uncharacterized protein L969DRAFT_18383 [Mixia osmundae IAM 14324]KEI38371.1 hypothetical protein L969DRAFT_18383 [Mixia osmundae IAM 14324]
MSLDDWIRLFSDEGQRTSYVVHYPPPRSTTLEPALASYNRSIPITTASLNERVSASPQRTRRRLSYSDPPEGLNASSDVQSVSLQSLVDLRGDPAYLITLRRHLYAFALDSEHALPYFFATPVGLRGAHQSEDPNWSLSASQREVAQNNEEPEYSASRRGHPCGHVFKKGETVYRCLQCGADDSVVLCSKCFHSSSHREHEITFSIHTSGCGCCDCGDVEAWDQGASCSLHAAAGASSSSSSTSHDEAVFTPESLRMDLEERLTGLAHFLAYTLAHTPEAIAEPVNADMIRTQLSPLELRRSVESFNTPALPVLGQPTSRSSPLARLLRSGSFAEPTRPAPAPALATGSFAPIGAGPWSLILWNDEKHSYADVIEQIRETFPERSKLDGMEVAMRVDSYGRVVLLVTDNVKQLQRAAVSLASIDLAVNVRSAHWTFFEAVCGQIITLFNDIVDASVGEDSLLLRKTLAKILLAPMPEALQKRCPLRPVRGHASQPRLSIFQLMLLCDHHLWKQARLDLRTLYVRLLATSQAVKACMGQQFAAVYLSLVTAFLNTDREPENSVLFFSVQIVTVRSVAAHLTSEHHFFSTVLGILCAYFIDEFDSYSSQRVSQLMAEHGPLKINPESSSFKYKKYFHMFNDLSHLLTSPGVQDIICGNPHVYVVDMTLFLSLFTGMNPSVRAVGQHVEYESDTWVTAFNLTIQLAKLVRSFGESFLRGAQESIGQAIHIVSSRLLGLDGASISHIALGGQMLPILPFEVAKEPVSFHNPLSWLLAELCRCLRAKHSTPVPKLLQSFGRLERQRQDVSYLHTIEPAIRVFALLAQIRAGLWVRNGFAIRAQQLHYREINLRESAYDQDVYLVQLMLASTPAGVMAALIDRFGLTSYLSDTVAQGDYDPGQLTVMTEELLGLLITMLSEQSNLASWSVTRCIERDIVHILALGQSAYSDMIKKLPDRLASDASFDSVLQQVAIYRAPNSAAGKGTYTLRPQYFDQVDPYYHRYTRNQKEEADKILLAHRTQNGHKTPDFDPPTALPTDIAGDLERIYESSELYLMIGRCIIIATLHHTEVAEVVVDEALHILALCLINCPEAASLAIADTQLAAKEDTISLGCLLVRLESDTRLTANRTRIAWILDQVEKSNPESASTLGRPVKRIIAKDDEASDALDARRRAAKARQAAIMQKFAAAQQTFLDTNIDAEADSDDGDSEDMTIEREDFGSCIVCQEAFNESRAFGSLASVQSSQILREIVPDGCILQDVINSPRSLDVPATPDRRRMLDIDPAYGCSQGYPIHASRPGLHASACGHMMHIRCFEVYFRSVALRHQQQPLRAHPEDVDRFEYICPLCKSLCNVILPVIDRSEKQAIPRANDPCGQDTVDWLLSNFDTEDDGHDLEMVYSATLLMGDPWDELTCWQDSHSSIDSEATGVTESDSYMLKRLLAVTFPLSIESRRDPELPDSGMYLPADLVAYTLAAGEVACRGTAQFEQGVVDDATSRLMTSLLDCLSSLAKHKISSLRAPEIVRFAIGSRLHADTPASPALGRSPLVSLVELAAVAPEDFEHASRLLYFVELIRTSHAIIELFAVPFDIDWPNEIAEEDHALGLHRVKPMLLAALSRVGAGSHQSHAYVQRISASLGPINDGLFTNLLHRFTLPFLRSVYRLRMIIERDAVPAKRDDDCAGEYAWLMQQLNLVTLTSVLDAEVSMAEDDTLLKRTMRDVLDSWLSNWYRVQEHKYNTVDERPLGWNACWLPFPLSYELVRLPSRLGELIEVTARRKCQTCNEAPQYGGLCLFCGELVCCQSFCCTQQLEDESQFGECNTHMWQCGGNVAAYLLMQKSAVLFLHEGVGCLLPAPYLDAHGETDLGMR